MAAGNFTFFNIAKGRWNGTTTGSTTYKAVLTTSSQALAATFTGSSGQARYADLTAEVANGDGYTTGGEALGSVTWNQATATWTFDAADTAWTLTGSGKTFKYIVLFDDGVANDPLIGFVDADTGGGSISAAAGVLTIVWNASGIFTLS